MSPYVQTVKTTSGATAVQILHSSRRGSLPNARLNPMVRRRSTVRFRKGAPGHQRHNPTEIRNLVGTLVGTNGPKHHAVEAPAVVAVPGWCKQLPRASAEGQPKTGPNPVDRARPGSKHHVITEAHGIPLAVSLTGPISPSSSR